MGTIFRTQAGEVFSISADMDTEFGSLKDEFASNFGVAKNSISFFYKTYLIKDSLKISDICIKEGSHITIRFNRREIGKSAFSEEKPEKRGERKDKADGKRKDIERRDLSPKSPKSPRSPVAEEPKDSALESIVSMGFTREQAKSALEASGGNQELAIQFLLEGGIPAEGTEAALRGKSMGEGITSLEDLEKQLSPDELNFCKSLVSPSADLDTIIQYFFINAKNKNATISMVKGM